MEIRRGGVELTQIVTLTAALATSIATAGAKTLLTLAELLGL
jgi:hypothetical protein